MSSLLKKELILNPLHHLLLYISIGCIINLDQASFAALLPTIKKQIPIGLNLSNSDLGLIGSFSMLFSTLLTNFCVFFPNKKFAQHPFLNLADLVLRCSPHIIFSRFLDSFLIKVSYKHWNMPFSPFILCLFTRNNPRVSKKS